MQRITNDLFESIRKITTPAVAVLAEDTQVKTDELDEAKKAKAKEKEEKGESKEKMETCEEVDQVKEALVGKQAVLDRNKNNKLDKEDFKIIRGEKTMKEEDESLEEASYSAKSARKGKDIGKPGKAFSAIASKAASKYGSMKKGQKVAGAVLAKLRAKHMKEDVALVEGVTETVIKHDDFVIEVTNNPTFADFLKAVQTIVPVQEEAEQTEVIAAAFEAFTEGNIDIVIEAFTRSEIGEKIAAHKKAGNSVSGEKFSIKDGKPYAEYVVTDSEGGRKKYIHHGTSRRMESMPGKK